MNTTLTRSIRIGLVAGLASLLLLSTLSSLAIKTGQTSFNTTATGAYLRLTRAAGTLPNGVAAGDTTQTSSVLWTRATTTGAVLFEYSTDSNLVNGVLTTTAIVTQVMQPAKVKLLGLNPATPYFYRATDAAGASATGRFRTAAPAGTHAGLRFGVSGDWGGHLAPYPAIANADERDLAFFVELGDTAYTDVSSPVLSSDAMTLDEFRLKHNEVYSAHLGLNLLADLRASTSILATIDDHEVRNDFAGGADASTDNRFPEMSGFINQTQLYKNGLQAFQEYNPLRDEFYGATGDNLTANKRKLYRFNTYGDDAAVFVLDTRSFRSEPLPLNDPTNLSQVLTFLTNSLTDTGRTLLGAVQLADLKAGLQQAQADGITWKFILVSGPIQNLGIFAAPDRYEGYAAERTDLLRFINQNQIENVVFITASLHGTIVNNLTYQEATSGPQLQTEAFEIIAGPIAIYPPFGPGIIDLAVGFGLISPQEKAQYDALSREGKDEFVRTLMDDLITFFNYDPIGLEGSGIGATLLQGSYVSVHTYGWTEFEVDQQSQALTVTTYGIDLYTQAELLANPNDIITRTPTIVSQFRVSPKVAVEAATISGPTSGGLNTPYAFIAAVSPVSATGLITYTWQAVDQVTMITQTSQLSNPITFAWTTTGPKAITVTVHNRSSPVSSSHLITITAALPDENRIYLPLILKP